MRCLRFLFLASTFQMSVLGVYSQITSVNLSTSKDSYVSSIGPTNNFGGLSPLYAGRLQFFSAWVNTRSMLQFDLSSIPTNAIIKSAKLKLHVNSSIGSPVLYTARLKASWVENTITWANQPAYETSDLITASSVVSGWHTVDVKNHVQKMVAGVYGNDGWIIYNYDEVSNVNMLKLFDSREASNSSLRPVLEIDYYIPITVSSADITHESSSGAHDGSVSPVLADGPGGLSYKWYNSAGTQISTNLNLTGVPYGWYGLEVSSTNTTDKFYYAFIVGLDCEEVDISFNPGPNYVDDAMLNYNFLIGSIEPTTNYGLSTVVEASGSIFSQRRSLLKFRVWVDSELIVNEATLKLTNYSSSGASANFKNVTSQWYENIVTASITPSTGSSVTLSYELITSNGLADIIDNVEDWKVDNNSNYGWLLELVSYSGYPIPHRIFYSSDYTTSSDRPKIDFKVIVSNPTPPHYCNQSFAKLERKLTGVKYKPYLKHFYFFYDEEYDVLDGELNYKIFEEDERLAPVMDSGSTPIEDIEYGDNRYAIDVSSLPVGIYILEVTNNKEEKFYLRFVQD